MKSQFILTAALGMLLFASCKDTAKETSTEPSTEVNTINADEHAGHNHGPEGNAHDTNTASGLNPEHGQPGHRCDIPAGAPLDTPPQNMPTQPTASTPSANGDGPFLVNDEAKGRISQENGATPSQPANPNGRTNPPHGQPGHVCG